MIDKDILIRLNFKVGDKWYMYKESDKHLIGIATITDIKDYGIMLDAVSDGYIYKDTALYEKIRSNSIICDYMFFDDNYRYIRGQEHALAYSRQVLEDKWDSYCRELNNVNNFNWNE